MKRLILLCALSLAAAALRAVGSDRLWPPTFASISGRVTAANQPVERFCVHLGSDTPEAGGLPIGIGGPSPWDGSIYWNSYAETNADGYYTLGPVHPGIKTVLFRECGFFGEDQHRYRSQWWAGQEGPATANRLYVVGHMTNINAQVIPYPDAR